MMQRPTLSDIARISGVSLATVDRVMNHRSGVSDRTRSQVNATARQLGYIEGDDTAPDSNYPPLRLVFVLPHGTNAFIHELERQVRQQIQHCEGVTAVIEPIIGFDPLSLAAKLRDLRGKTDGIALLAVDHPAVREAVRSLIHSGTFVVTLANDIQAVPHLGHIGIDNGQAGRLAGYMMGRLLRTDRSAKVAFFAGSLAFRGHQERDMGFRQILSEEFQHLNLVAQCELHEDRELAHAEMTALLAQHPDLAGIYNAGGATGGIARALSDHKIGRKIIFVAHDLTDRNKALLLDGTLDAVIDQNARVEIREAINTLVHAARGQDYRMVPPRLQIIFRENLPSE